MCSQDLQYHSQDSPSKTNRMMRILMFVRILSLIRLVRVSRLVRFFNEVEKVSGEEPHSPLEAQRSHPASPVADPLTGSPHRVTSKVGSNTQSEEPLLGTRLLISDISSGHRAHITLHYITLQFKTSFMLTVHSFHVMTSLVYSGF